MSMAKCVLIALCLLLVGALCISADEVVVTKDAHVIIEDEGLRGGNAVVHLNGIKPKLLPSKYLKDTPKPEVSGNKYVFRSREVHLRRSPSDVVNVYYEGTVTGKVIIEVPKGVPIYFGEKDPPPKK